MEVAVKVLRRSMLEMGEGIEEEFEREIGFMQRTRHSNIVRFFGAGRQEDGTPFLVEELMSGGTLTKLLRGTNSRALDWNTKAALATDVARGMSYIHMQGHVHRDLKSGNVLITESLQAKVADFGSVGRLLSERPADRTSSRLSVASFASDSELELTQGVGTPMYMSLEMLRHAGYDERTDVWSFGVLLWEIAAQAPPDLLQQEGFKRGPAFSGLLRLLESGCRLTIGAEWPDPWRPLVAQCMQQDPEARPDFPSLVRTLEGIREGSAAQTTVPAP